MAKTFVGSVAGDPETITNALSSKFPEVTFTTEPRDHRHEVFMEKEGEVGKPLFDQIRREIGNVSNPVEPKDAEVTGKPFAKPTVE